MRQDVFAIVEHDQQLAGEERIRDRVDQPSTWLLIDADGGCQRVRDHARLADGVELDQPDTVREQRRARRIVHEIEAKLNGQARLARPAGTNERDQASFAKVPAQVNQLRFASDTCRQWCWQIRGQRRSAGWRTRLGRRARLRARGELERCALVTLEAERRDQAVGAVRVRSTVTPLEVLNRAQAQSSTLSKVFLRQARGKSVRA